MRRAGTIAVGTLLVLLAAVVLLAGGVWVLGNSASGRSFIERITYSMTHGQVRLSGLDGALFSEFTLAHLQLVDSQGVWLAADDIAVRWSPAALWDRRIQIGAAHIRRVQVTRLPVSEGAGGGKTTLPHVDIAAASVDALELSAALAGQPATLSVGGSVRLRSLLDAGADLSVRRTDGDGNYTLHLRMDPERIDASVVLHEPAGGPLEHLLQLPGLGALSATLELQGPRVAEQVSLSLDAGDLRVRAQGSMDLVKSAADLEVSAGSPALRVRPDLAWQRVDLRGRWRGPWNAAVADGQFEVKGLQLPGNSQVDLLSARLVADAGTLRMNATAAGVQIPGSAPRLLAADPITLDATLGLQDVARPLALTASHRLFTVRAQAVTAGDLHGTLDLRVPQLAPFAGLLGQDVSGDANIAATVAGNTTEATLAMDAKVGLTGGKAAWVALLGPRLAVQLSAAMSEDKFSVRNLALSGRTLTASASGEVTRRQGAALKARWQVDMANLSLLSADLAGRLQASGRLNGPVNALSGDATMTSALSVRGSPSGTIGAEVRLHGLPGAPSGSVQVHGMFDGAPLQVDVDLERGAGALRTVVRKAEWKSAHLDGDLSLGADAAARGQLRLHLGQLGDFDRLSGMMLGGSLDATAGVTSTAGTPRWQIDLDGRNLAVGQVTGAAHLQAAGTQRALELQLHAELPDVAGTALQVSTAAVLDADTRALRVTTANAQYRGQTVKLLAPAQLSFADGLAIDLLRLGVQEASLEISGRLTPALDLHAALFKVKPALVNAFAPALLAEGLIEAGATLHGSLAAPTGPIRVDATDIRFADDAATGLPPANLRAKALLAGTTAELDGRLTAGDNSSIVVTGNAPLDLGGALALKVAGQLDLTMINPVLEAKGLHATGAVAVDAVVAGSASAPQIGGSIKLAKGNLRDYGRGINLTDMSADIAGSEGALKINSFKATAGSGTLTMTGSLGLLQPKMPVDLHITARNAQPIASNIVTANMDADLHVVGTVRQRIDVAGTLHVNQANIGIPDTLPPDVAVLDVRRRGTAAVARKDQPQFVIGVDVTVTAPRQILVQGRGLDAELGGEIHVGGTTDALLVGGEFGLQRGSFTLAGTKLDFSPDSKLSFDGAGLSKKIDPTLDFTAQSTSNDNTTTTLHITGVADAPRFDFSSSPALPPDEIMARLLFGTSAAQLTALQAAEIGAALASLSGVGGGGASPLSKLQKSLGLDRLTVGSGTKETASGTTESSGAAIAAGRYVSKRVYIEGKQSTTGSSQVQVDVDLTKHLKLQTRLGTGSSVTQGTTPDNDPGSSVGLSYQFEY